VPRLTSFVLAALAVAAAIGLQATSSSTVGATVNDASLTAPAPGASCTKTAISISVGSVIPATDLAAVTFLSVDVGMGVTTPEIDCTDPSGAVVTGPFPALLTVSTDGGHVWKVEGSTSPPNVVHATDQPIAVAFASTKHGWLSANGRLEETSDGGDHWAAVNFDGAPVVTVQRVAGVIEAVTALRWHLWRLILPSGAWRSAATIPKMSDIPSVPTPFVITALGPAPEDAVVASSKFGNGSLQMTVTVNGGSTWSVATDPCVSPTWVAVAALTAAPNGTISVLCGGGGAAGSATRGFYVSTSHGAIWSLRASNTNLGTPNSSGIPVEDFGDVLISPSTTHYFLAVDNDFTTSSDGGDYWSGVSVDGVPARGGEGYNLEGAGRESEFDVLSGTEVWMLTPGVGLFRTTNGQSWRIA
jgi:hypothetical protein